METVYGGGSLPPSIRCLTLGETYSLASWGRLHGDPQCPFLLPLRYRCLSRCVHGAPSFPCSWGGSHVSTSWPMRCVCVWGGNVCTFEVVSVKGTGEPPSWNEEVVASSRGWREKPTSEDGTTEPVPGPLHDLSGQGECPPGVPERCHLPWCASYCYWRLPVSAATPVL